MKANIYRLTGCSELSRKASHSGAVDVNKHVLGVYYRRKMRTLKRKPSGYKVGGVSAYFFAPRFILYYLSLFNI